eukprot:3156843-Prorocentrum_lima.AAC.1
MLWGVSTSVEQHRRGPFLISQMQGTARTYMVAQLEVPAELFTRGGRASYHGHVIEVSGLQHVIAALGLYS